MSRLEIILGCMFSGKSSELIRRLKRYKAINKNVLVINSFKDSRSENEVLKTHDNIMFDCVKTNNLMDLVHTSEYRNSPIIGIDEAQFFSHLMDFVKFSLSKNKHVIIAGLDGDFKQNMFGEILYLIPLADSVDKLNAYCMDCKDGTLAPFTKRISNSEGEQELVGSQDIYKAVCREHLLDPVDRLLEAYLNETLDVNRLM